MCGGKQQPKLRRDAAAAARLHPEFSGCWVISASRSKIDKESVSLASPFHCCRACELQAPKKPWCDLSGRENSQGKRLWKSLAVTHCCVLSVTVLSSVLPSAPDGRCDRIPPNRVALRFCVCLDVWLLNPLCSSVRLYAVGGRDGSSCLRSVECFDPHTNKWSMCASMSKRRGGVGVATYNNFLYAVGGHDAPASNHCSRLSDCVERWVWGGRHRMTKWFESAVKIINYRGGDGTLDSSWILPPSSCVIVRSHGFHRGGLFYSIWRHLLATVLSWNDLWN